MNVRSPFARPEVVCPQAASPLGRALLVAATLTLAAGPALAQTYYWQNFAGLPGTSGSTDGTGSAARFYYPNGSAFDKSGNLFVADNWNNTIRKITPAGVVITFAGAAGQSGSADGTGTNARFNWPTGLAMDGQDNLFVTVYGSHTIRKITSAGVVTTVAGSPGVSGSADGTGGAARFYRPFGIAVDTSGNLFVSDAYNSTIRKVTPDAVVTTLAGSAGTTGSANGTGSAARFWFPMGIGVGPTGDIYVADTHNFLIRKVTPAGVVTTAAGIAGSLGDLDGNVSVAKFNYPTGVVADAAGNLFVANLDGQTIRKISPAGMVTTLGGLAGSSGTADGVGNAARFKNPRFLTLDAAGNLYVADEANHRISKGTPSDLLNGCVAWWRGEDNFQDSAGGNHGTAMNGAACATGEVGKGWSFDGTNDYVQVPSSANLNLVSGQGWTMEGWIKPDVLGDQTIAHKGEAADGSFIPYWGFVIRSEPVGQLALEVCPGTGQYQYDGIASLVPVVANVWQHVAVVVEDMGGAGSGYHIYINGISAGSALTTDRVTTGTVNTAAPLCIGSFRGQSNFFDGQIDELAIYNRALTPAEISLIHTAGSAGKTGNVGVAPAIATASPLAEGRVGDAYSQTFAATGGVSPYTWTVSAGTLPEGLLLSSTGELTGTPTASGTANFTVRATGSDTGTVTKDFSLTIQPAAVAPTISTTSPLPSGRVAVAYSQSFAATGGVGPYTWIVTAGSLPAGLSLSSAGTLTGTPTAAGTANFTVRATGSDTGTVTKDFSLTVQPAAVAPTISTTSPLPSGRVAVAYSQPLTATGGVGPYTWTVSTGSLPAGLTLSSAGALTGTPTAAGTANFTVRATGADTGTVTKDFSLMIQPAAVAPIISTASPLANGRVGIPYAQPFAASGGVGPYTWSVASGQLPGGLTLSGAGNLSGTPTAEGSFTFTVRATGSDTGTSTKVFSLTIDPAPVPPVIGTGSPLPEGMVGNAYSQSLAASGGFAPYTWSLDSGTLPAGLSLAGDGTLSGMPTAAGTVNFIVRVTGTDTGSSTKSLALTIQPPSAELAMLSLSGVTLAPVFAPGTTSYTGVSYADRTSVIAAPSSFGAMIEVRYDGSPWLPVIPFVQTTDFLLPEGSGNMLEIKVTATDGITTRIYAVDITRYAPEIVVQNSEVALVDGATSPQWFGYNSLGHGVTQAFTITNTGTGNLQLGAFTVDGAHTADFTVGAPVATSVPAGGSTTFTVVFTPRAGGTRTASLRLPSNVLGSANPFDIALKGNGLDYTTDGDGDGLSDGAEFDLTNLGFHWRIAQPTLVQTLFQGAGGAGLYTMQQLRALKIDTPLLARNPAIGEFTLTLTLEKSDDLSHFTPFSLLPLRTEINAQGQLEIHFGSSDNAAFYRIEAK